MVQTCVDQTRMNPYANTIVCIYSIMIIAFTNIWMLTGICQHKSNGWEGRTPKSILYIYSEWIKKQREN